MNSNGVKITVTSKGQIVIPAGFREKFGIKKGTQVLVTESNSGILLQPITAGAVRRAYGVLKQPRKPGEKSFAEEWAEHKKEEREFEEHKI
jgi:AbrB family looped-hinge helix DNA binding protein